MVVTIRCLKGKGGWQRERKQQVEYVYAKEKCVLNEVDPGGHEKG